MGEVSFSKGRRNMIKIVMGPLIDTRRNFDTRVREKFDLVGVSLIKENIAALQVELGELMKEWDQFKYWKKHKKTDFPNMLEEYADGLHFILTIFDERLKLFPELEEHIFIYPEDGLQHDKTKIIDEHLHVMMYSCFLTQPIFDHYVKTLQHYMNLGYYLGFTWDEVVKAFLKKHKKNHIRMDSDY